MTLAVALVLRSWRLADRSIQFDEAFSWRLARCGWAELLNRATQDNNPPLYYGLLKLWTGCFGDSPLALRSLSVAAGTAACFGIYLLVVEAYRGGVGVQRARWMAVFTSALAATCVLQVRWGWEARMYALGAALSAFSGWLLLRALGVSRSTEAAPERGRAADRLRGAPCVGNRSENGSPPWWWVAYVVVALAFAFTHTAAVLSLVAQAVFAAGYLVAASGWRIRPLLASPKFRHTALAAAAVAAGWGAWLPVLLSQREHVRQTPWVWHFDAWGLPVVCHQMFVDTEEFVGTRPEALYAAALCAGVLLALLWRPHSGDWFGFASATVPLTILVAITLADARIFHLRYLVFSQLFLLTAIARLVGRIPSTTLRTLVAAVVVANLLLLYADFWRRLDIAGKPGVRAAVDHIIEQGGGSDDVIVASPFFYLAMMYHLPVRDNCRLLDPGRPLWHYEGAAVVAKRELIATDELRALRGPRLWVLNNDHGRWPPAQVQPPAGADWREVSREWFPEPYAVQGWAQLIEYRVSP